MASSMWSKSAGRWYQVYPDPARPLPVDDLAVVPADGQLTARWEAPNLWGVAGATVPIVGYQISVDGGTPIEVALTDRVAGAQRTNLVPNPSFGVDTSRWVIGGTGTTVARVTGDQKYGTGCAEVTKAAVANSGIITETGAMLPVVVGQAYTASAWVKVPAGQEDCPDLHLHMVFYDAANAAVQTNGSGNFAVVAGSDWRQLVATGTAPATATYCRIRVRQATAGTAGKKFLVDGVLLEKASRYYPYFDGVSADSALSSPTLAWTGTANNSTSTCTSNIYGKVFTGLTNGQSYSIKVRSVGSNGAVSAWSTPVVASPFHASAATGGTVTDVPNYNGTGEKWRLHTFTADGTFTVTDATQPFRILAVGGGGGGGTGWGGAYQGGAGGNGGYAESLSKTLTAQAYAVVVGQGGAGSVAQSYDGGGKGGGVSTITDLSAAGGSGGPSTYSNVSGTPGASKPTVSSNIRGNGNETWSGTDGKGNPGGGSFNIQTSGDAGAAGVVMIAYRIG